MENKNPSYCVVNTATSLTIKDKKCLFFGYIINGSNSDNSFRILDGDIEVIPPTLAIKENSVVLPVGIELKNGLTVVNCPSAFSAGNVSMTILYC